MTPSVSLERHTRSRALGMGQAALRPGERFERGFGLEAPGSCARFALGLSDRDQKLFGGGEALSRRRGHLEPQAHALVVVLEQVTGHGEGVAFLRLLEIV